MQMKHRVRVKRMSSHALANRLLARPDMPVAGLYQMRLVGVTQVQWMHDYGNTVDTCQSDTEKKSKNCFACNSGRPRMQVAILSGCDL